MNVVEDEIVKRLSKKYNKKGEMIAVMLEKYKELGYNIKSFEKKCEDFFDICY